MRIATSALLGMTLTLAGAAARAQPIDAPPQPPPPDSAPQSEPPEPIASPFPREGDGSHLAGWADGFYLRDGRDLIRLYPQGMVQVDVLGFAGPGVSAVPAPDKEVGLSPRFFVRRARLGLGGELLHRMSFLVSAELGGQPIGNAGGGAQTAAGKAGEQPTGLTARYAPIQSTPASAALADVWFNYSVCPCLNLMLGQFNAPFSMENRTPDEYTPWMERNLAIRGFVVPSSREIGGMLWGELGPGVFSYELGVFGGDGQNRPGVDRKADFIGRIYARPLAGAGTSTLARSAQLGLSARHGDRDPALVGYDYPAISTGSGFVLWAPTYTDALGRLVHVIPSGSQNAIGGELRARTDRVALQGEAYYVVNDTREAIDGYQLTNNERFGRMAGVGWYVQLSGWPFRDAFVAPEPGISRPIHLDVAAKAPEKNPHGIEVMAIAAGINANYRSATRLASTPDPKAPAEAITVYQIGLGAQYWYTKHLRLAFNYMLYDTPGSGGKSNAAVTPDNLRADASGKPGQGHLLHELGARLSANF